MTTVVTGASGHVGGNLVRALLADGEKVRCLVRDDTRALDGLDVELVRGDVREPESLRAAFDGADAVYHLAALISIVGDQGGRVSGINVDGARNAAEAALDAGVRRYLHCSSIHAFDTEPNDEPLDETRARSGPRHAAYDRSKAAGEAAVREVVARGLDAVIVHPTAVLGPYDFKLSRMGHVLVDLCRRTLPALVPGGYNWVDVRDVVRGMRSAMEKGRTNESYLLSGHWRPVAELAILAADVTGSAPPRLTSPLWLAAFGAPFVETWYSLFGGEPLYTRESLVALRSHRHIVHDKASRELDYVPRSTEETLRAAYAWYREAGLVSYSDRPILEEAP